MMNVQNPSFPQHPYGRANAMVQPESMAHFPADLSQNQFQQPASFQNTPQRAGQFPSQFQGQTPAQLYQKLQQHQQQQQLGTGARPQHAAGIGGGASQIPRQSPGNPHSRSQSVNSQGNAPNTPSRQMSAPSQPNMNPQNSMTAQAVPGINTSQAPRPSMQQSSAPMSPQAVAREEERVTTLLEINAHLIQEVTSLQAQGKAGSAGQSSPTSPVAGNSAGANSPSDGTKRQPPSPEYADCMRRLQANLAYLAAIADANKKATQPRPNAPAIIYPPQHLSSVHPLYQKLNVLFPEASQSTVNKAVAFANAQAARNVAATSNTSAAST